MSSGIGATLYLFIDDSSFEAWANKTSELLASTGALVVSGPAPEHFDAALPCAVVSNDVNWSVHIAATRTHVFSNGELPPFPSVPVSFHDRHELYKASRNLVIGADLIEKGAVYVDGLKGRLKVAGLGEIVAEAVSIRAREDSPLSVYNQLPPKVGASAEWPSQLFSFRPEAFFDGSPDMDITGRGRVLVHGPYLYLPSGRWEAVIRFIAEPITRRIPIRVSWGCEAGFTSTEHDITIAGIYDLNLKTDFAGPGAAQVIVELREPMFDGFLQFQGCRIAKLASTSI